MRDLTTPFSGDRDRPSADDIPASVDLAIRPLVELTLQPLVDRHDLETRLKRATRLAFTGAALTFFEGEHTLWLAETTRLAIELASVIGDNTYVAAPLLATFFEHRIFDLIETRFQQLRPDAGRRRAGDGPDEA